MNKIATSCFHRVFRVLISVVVLILAAYTDIYKNLYMLDIQPLNGAVSVYYDKDGKKYTYVKGYKKQDGTYIKGYYRSVSDKDKSNNWSSKGNINPYTGKKGYK